MSAPQVPSAPPVPRQSWSESERKEVREYYEGASARTYKDVIEWYRLKNPNKILTKPQLSRIINPRPTRRGADLDLDLINNMSKNRVRARVGYWPELESALNDWHKLMTLRRIPISGADIQAKAQWYWDRMEIYKDNEAPKFSRHWLEGWKKRYGVKRQRFHGEGGGVEITEETHRQMHEIQLVLMEFERCDIFNMDETGLYWRRQPQVTLSSTSGSSGTKLSKTRITAVLCCNADGSHKLKIWLIGYYLNPRAFANVDKS